MVTLRFPKMAGKALAASLLMAAATAIPAHAAPPLTAGMLYGYCTAADSAHQAACFHYIAGVTDIFGYTGCAPAGFAHAAARDMVMGYIRRHPEQRGQYARDVVVSALNAIFACEG